MSLGKIKLSKNISLDEMIASDEAKEHRIINMPNDIEIQRMVILSKNILQPVRDHFEKPVLISSGFRCPKLNELVGGVSTADNISQHTKGEASDFTVKGISNKDIFLFILNNLEFDQLIYEFGRWIHASYRTGNNRKEALVATKVNGKIHNLKYVDEEQLA